MDNNNTSSDTSVRSDGRSMEEDVMIEMEHNMKSGLKVAKSFHV